MLSFLSTFLWRDSHPKRSYGWRKDTYNEHVLATRPEMSTFKTFVKHPRFDNIKVVDLRSSFPPVYDQGQLGSCVFNACDGAYGFEMMKQGEQYVSMSRLFMYYNTRLAEGTVDQDSGAEIKDAVYQLGTYNDAHGTCTEDLWPYDIAQFKTKPSDACYTDAKFHRVVSAERIQQNLIDLKQSLLDGYPVIFGFSVYESFESDDVAKTGKMPMPTPTDKLLGGHGVVLAGFDDTQSVFIVRNSWGTAWGDNGYFYMPYDFIVKPEYASDFWSIRMVKDDDVKPAEKVETPVQHKVSVYDHYPSESTNDVYSDDFDSDEPELDVDDIIDSDETIDSDDDLPKLVPIVQQNNVFNETIKNMINKDFDFAPKCASAVDIASYKIKSLIHDASTRENDFVKRLEQLKKNAIEASHIAQLKQTAYSVASSVIDSVVNKNPSTKDDVDLIDL